MSYYTTIYPKGEFEETNIEKINEEIEKSERLIQSKWQDIIALCAASPTNIKEAVQEIKIDFSTYIVYYRLYCKECFNHQYLTSTALVENPELEKHIEWNHFEHNSDPEKGIKEEQKSIDYVENKLVMLCAASPEKIYSNKDADGNPVNPLDWMNEELNNLKEYLDESIYCKVFCELCVKYWDTHEEG